MSECPTPGKRVYEDRDGAVAHARWLRRGGASPDVLPYRCPAGDHWHVGHSQVSLRRRIRRAITRRAMTTQTYTGTLVVQQCCACHITFGVPSDFDAARLRDHRSFYCPNGHGQSYTGKTDEQKLRDQLEQEQTRLIRERNRRQQAEEETAAARRRAAAARGQVTKIKRRVGRGVCPCCNRTFADLGRHMAGQHPDFADGAS